MGLDLTLVPRRFDMNWFLASQRIHLDRDYQIFGQIAKGCGRDDSVVPVCSPAPLPPGTQFQWYEDDGLKTRTTDPYGSKLTYVSAADLAKVKLPNDASQWNRAVFAFVRAMPPDTWIALWWH